MRFETRQDKVFHLIALPGNLVIIILCFLVAPAVFGLEAGVLSVLLMAVPYFILYAAWAWLAAEVAYARPRRRETRKWLAERRAEWAEEDARRREFWVGLEARAREQARAEKEVPE